MCGCCQFAGEISVILFYYYFNDASEKHGDINHSNKNNSDS